MKRISKYVYFYKGKYKLSETRAMRLLDTIIIDLALKKIEISSPALRSRRWFYVKSYFLTTIYTFLYNRLLIEIAK